jgi:hypothetical protein
MNTPGRRIHPLLIITISSCQAAKHFGVTLQGRGAGCKLCCGLGVRAVRAGSIGREAHTPVNGLSFRQRRREALAPAPSTKKPAPQGSNPAMAGPGPQAMEALCLYAEPSSRASNHPPLKGYCQNSLDIPWPIFYITLTQKRVLSAQAKAGEASCLRPA